MLADVYKGGVRQSLKTPAELLPPKADTSVVSETKGRQKLTRNIWKVSAVSAVIGVVA